MAVGPVVTLGSRVVASYDAGWWGPLTTFRSHGRMIWALHYALIAAIAFAATRFAPRTAVGLLAAAVAVQAVDVAGMRRDLHSPNDFGFRDPLVSPFWEVAAPHFERLVLVPTNLCDRNGAVDYRAFGLLAGRHGLALNAGSASRHDERRTAEYCLAMAQERREGLAQPGTLTSCVRICCPRCRPSARRAAPRAPSSTGSGSASPRRRPRDGATRLGSAAGCLPPGSEPTPVTIGLPDTAGLTTFSACLVLCLLPRWP